MGLPPREGRLDAHATENVVDLVARQEVDLGFIHAEATEPTILSRVVASSRLLCLLRRGHPLARLKLISPEDLVGIPIVTFGADSPVGWLVREAFRVTGVSLDGSIETNQSAAAITLVQAGTALAIVDAWVMSGAIPPQLVARPLRPGMIYHAKVIYSRFRPPSVLAEQFLHELEWVSNRLHPVQRVPHPAKV